MSLSFSRHLKPHPHPLEDFDNVKLNYDKNSKERKSEIINLYNQLHKIKNISYDTVFTDYLLNNAEVDKQNCYIRHFVEHYEKRIKLFENDIITLYHALYVIEPSESTKVFIEETNKKIEQHNNELEAMKLKIQIIMKESAHNEAYIWYERAKKKVIEMIPTTENHKHLQNRIKEMIASET